MIYVFEHNDKKSAELHQASNYVKSNPESYDLIELENESDAGHVIGGKAYSVGCMSSNPQAELLHDARKSVLSEEGFNSDDAEVIVIKDKGWARSIDAQISIMLNR